MHFSESPWPELSPKSGFGHGSDQKTNFPSAGVCLGSRKKNHFFGISCDTKETHSPDGAVKKKRQH